MYPRNKNANYRKSREKRTFFTKIFWRDGFLYLILGIWFFTVCFVMTGCTSREELIVQSSAREGLAQNEETGQTESTEKRGTGTEEGTGETYAGQEHAGWEYAGQESGKQSETLTETGTVTAETNRKQTGEDAGTEETGKPSKIYVHVCGAVKAPGVYEFQEETRLFEAVEAAGGFTEEADGDYVNQAEPLADGMKIQIPTRAQTAEWIAAGDILMQQEVVTLATADAQNGSGRNTLQQNTAGTEAGKTQAGGAGSRVNINLADEAALCTITGIGQGRAKAIITYREKNGGFRAVEDIMKVDGIKQATFEKIKEQICVE